jgi:hypothetical protein
VVPSTELNLEELLGELSQRRPIFHSEADFQHELALIIREQASHLNVRLEVPQASGITLDVLISNRINGDNFVVELKYKTAAWEGVAHGESFRLKNHGADDLGGYDVLRDIERVESLVDSGASGGAVIFLTNEPLYWKPRRERSKPTNAYEFRVHEGLNLTGTRSWGPNTGGTSRGRESSISLRGTYETSWQPYSNVGGIHGEFRQLVFITSGR